MATARGSDWGRFVAERGLYCLPTGRRFELAERNGRRHRVMTRSLGWCPKSLHHFPWDGPRAS